MADTALNPEQKLCPGLISLLNLARSQHDLRNACADTAEEELRCPPAAVAAEAMTQWYPGAFSLRVSLLAVVHLSGDFLDLAQTVPKSFPKSWKTIPKKTCHVG